MTITAPAQSLILDGEITARGPGWQTRDGGTVQIAGTRYTVQIQSFDNGMDSEVRLTGPRGGVYFLRPFLGPDTGRRQIVRYNGGEPLRIRGNEVRAFLVGDLLTIEFVR